MDYQPSLNLPKTDFPMRANLPKREPEIQRFWEEQDVYNRVLEVRRDSDTFILHDGPPYANGNIHIGTALNKILKDIVNRFATMDGYRVPYVPGWDTHGLPIELKALGDSNLTRRDDPVLIRRRCREYALKYVDIQREEFKRLGVIGDWDNPYLTLKPEFEARQIEIFGEMAKKGYIYKGLKPVYWCADCETALAEAEVEYHDDRSPSIYVAFKVTDGKGLLEEGQASFLIWTTTPWTIPANLAIALHPDAEYVEVESPRGRVVLARELLEQAFSDMELQPGEVLRTFTGRQLEGIICRHPLLERDSVVILGDHVTLEQGTGCVHTAPGHGLEDYEVGRKYGLEILNPVDDRGYFTEKAGPFAGLFYDKANKAITKALDEAGALFKLNFITHQYPHCWRCKSPVIFRATDQWFASVDGFREQALKAIEEVKWIPPWGEERISNMVEGRTDWCISRQRVWGVPIPIFYCSGCGEPVINDDTIKAVADLFRREGSDSWFEKSASEILPEGFTCPECGASEFEKESDIMDVWFDSGSTHAAVLETRDDLSWPADLYLEGSDQHRGWFQSSLLTAVATKGRAPYRQVLTHGFVVDGEGRKMSKSIGNVIYPQEVIQQYGADILRLWVASSDYRGDIRISPDILKQMAEVYRKIRNTLRFILGNLYDFDPSKDRVDYGGLLEIDRWALSRLQRLVEKVTRAYRSYEYHLLYHDIHNFCVIDMSAFYMNILKDRLYCSGADWPERRAAQTVLYEVGRCLTKLIAPVLVHTAEEIWQYFPRLDEDPISIQMTDWPKVDPSLIDPEIEERWKALIAVRERVSSVLEKARAAKEIGDSLESRLDIYAGGEIKDLLEDYAGDLPSILIVSGVALHDLSEKPDGIEEVDGIAVRVSRAAGKKCERCWTYSEKTGTDADHPGICPRCTEAVIGRE